MANNIQRPIHSGPNLGDTVYVLFRHKWKIILITLLALGSAIAYYLRSTPPYVSEAKLALRYLMDTPPVDPNGAETRVRGMNDTSDTIMKSETAILTSWDLARDVAAEIGPVRLSGVVGSPASAVDAVIKGLTVTTEKGSNLIVATFAHPDGQLVKTVLDTVVTEYFKRHLAFHRSAESREFVSELLDKAKRSLSGIDTELKKAKNGSSLPLAQLRENLDVELKKARTDYEAAETAEAEQKARVEEISKLVSTGSGGNQPKATSAQEPPAAAQAPSAAVISKYQDTIASLTLLRQNLNTRKLTYQSGSEMLRGIEEEIASLDHKRQDIEKEFPLILATAATGPGTVPARGMDLNEERTHLLALTARSKSVQLRLSDLQKEVKDLDEKSLAISVLERDREVQQKNVIFMGTRLVEAQVDATLDPKRMRNIDIIQAATPGALDVKRRNQITMAIAAGGPALGVGLVLLFGLFLNRTVKRSLELEESMGMPLVMTIPFFSRRQRLRACRPMGTAKATKALKNSEPGKAPWEQYHFIRPFAEAIRDRLSLYFETSGIVRKPKLIGVTGYAPGAGTSTLASALASSLSETGEGKVLLVDMNGAHGEVHPFFDGRPALSLSKALRTSAAELPPGPDTGTRENLFLARAEAPRGGAAAVGLRRMMPDLKASDFDYVIFDMPPLGQTKPTATMGGLLDRVIVVVEAEANSRSEVRRGYRDLVDAGAEVSMVFNKAQFHGPSALAGSH